MEFAGFVEAVSNVAAVNDAMPAPAVDGTTSPFEPAALLKAIAPSAVVSVDTLPVVVAEFAVGESNSAPFLFSAVPFLVFLIVLVEPSELTTALVAEVLTCP